MKPVMLLSAGALFLAPTYAESDFISAARADDPPVAVVANPQGPTIPQTKARPVKSPAVAYVWTAGTTALPIILVNSLGGPEGDFLGNRHVSNRTAIVLTALMIGPSAGQYYAGSPVQGTVGMAVRILAVPLAAVAAHAALSGGGSFVVPVVLFVGGTAYSLIDTKFAVDRANERARKASVQTSFVPMLLPVTEGRLAPGLVFHASF